MATFGGQSGVGTSVETGELADGAVTNAKVSDTAAIARTKLADVSTTSRLIGRKTSGAGADEEITIEEALNFVASLAQGDILYRNGTTWVRLGAGTSGQFLKTQGAAANPVWADATASTLLEASGADVNITNDTTETNIFSISVPGGVLSTNKAIRGYVHITNARFNDTNATLTLRLKYGATTLITMVIDPSAGTGGSHKGEIHFMLFANASATAQSAYMRARLKTETLDPVNTAAGDNMEASAVGTATENSAGALNLVLSAQWATAALDNDFQRRGYVVEKVV